MLSQLAPTPREAEALAHEWAFWARPAQLAPAGNWTVWLILAGRGFGKTRTAAEWARAQAAAMPGSRGALVARTAADSRDVLVEGESGILAICAPWDRPVYEPSKRRLTWPNGSVATLYSADKPDLLRGPQHHWAVADELAAWRYAEAWDQLMFGLRLGDHPRVTVATTPRPTPIIRELVRDANVAVTRGSTYDNQVNLAPAFMRQIITKYEGTRLGRQELLAEILDDVPGALWTREILDRGRVRRAPALARLVVAVDPAVSAGEAANETGIVVVGRGEDGHGYVLEDVSSKGSPAEWAAAAVMAFDRWGADRIVAEVNQGGDMVEHTIRTAAQDLHQRGKRGTGYVSFRQVRASRGKFTRAEPVSALYEQGRMHHVGMLAELEDQMCTWLPGEESPDRMDALVWGATELMMLEMAADVGPNIWG
jgi:phage terminase large subunit-like protein